MITRCDPSLDTLLDLDGQVLVIDEAGCWVKFVVHQVPASADKPHGIDDTLTMHGPGGARLVGFENAHKMAGQGRAGELPRTTGTGCTVKPFEYTDAGALVAAFRHKVESMMRGKGVWT